MMPRKMMDYRMMRDSRRNRRMRDRAMRRGMDYADYRRDYRGGDMEYDSRRGDYAYNEQDNARSRRDYESGRQSDMGYDYADMRRRRNSKGQYMSDRGYEYMDGHYPMVQGYMPIEAMGRFTGYWGEPENDYGRGRDYGYYDMGGDYGETLTKEELEEWCKKMTHKLNDREKQMLSKEAILQRAKSMGVEFKDFNEMEYYVNVVRNYTDHKKSIGENLDMAMKLAKDDFYDEDGMYEGSEWLAIYYDTFVEE